MEGTVNPADFRLFIGEFIRDQNALNLSKCWQHFPPSLLIAPTETTECVLSKPTLDWNMDGSPCPVVDFESHTCVTDSLSIFNNNKSKKIYFEFNYVNNPKFQLEISPESGEIRKV